MLPPVNATVIKNWWDELERLARILGQVGPDEVCCEGLSQRQCSILRILVAQEGARISDLAATSGITPSAMTRVLEIQTNDASARFNRALAYLQSGKLDNARADYSFLQTVYTNSFQIAYGLGEVAWRKNETNEAVRNFKLYLDNAPTNSAEFQSVRDRLNQLRGK